MSATATAPVRRIADAPELPVDDAEQIDMEDEGYFDHDPVPGEKVFDYGDGSKDGRFDGTYTGDDPSHVAIYDITGRRFTMPKDWAVLRLRKRFPANHPSYPSMKVFYPKAPREFPTPTVPCPSQWAVNCRKFYSEQQARVHFQRRHETEHRTRLEEDTRTREERMVRAQEQQVTLMSALLGRLAGGEPVSQEEIAAATAPVEVPAAAVTGPVLTDIPDESWKVSQYREWLALHELPPLARNGVGITQPEAWAHVKQFITN